MQCTAAQWNAMQCNAMQYYTTQCNAITARLLCHTLSYSGLASHDEVTHQLINNSLLTVSLKSNFLVKFEKVSRNIEIPRDSVKGLLWILQKKFYPAVSKMPRKRNLSIASLPESKVSWKQFIIIASICWSIYFYDASNYDIAIAVLKITPENSANQKRS